MKKINFLALIIITISLLSFTKEQPVKTAKEFGKELFGFIKSNNDKGVLQLVVTKEDMVEITHQSNFPDSVKEQFVAAYEENKAKSEQSIQRGFMEITKDIQEKKCNESVELTKITPTISKLQNLPVELGTLEVEYTCNSETEAFDVEIINTAKGWKIVEGLRRKPK